MAGRLYVSMHRASARCRPIRHSPSQPTSHSRQKLEDVGVVIEKRVLRNVARELPLDVCV
jgi:hypothetical protein